MITGLANRASRFQNFWGEECPEPLAAHAFCTCVSQQCLKKIPILYTQKVGHTSNIFKKLALTASVVSGSLYFSALTVQ